MERQDFPRFGLGGFAFRFPTETDRIEITVRGDLSIAHGAPIRLVAPAHYGYKNIKHLRSIEFWTHAREYRFPGPRFMDHSRARVALEERGRGAPAWLLRRIYPALVRPISWLFRFALGRHLARQESPRDSQP